MHNCKQQSGFMQTIKEFQHRLPERWRGDGYRILKDMELAIVPVLSGNNLDWHFAMKNLMPEDYFTFYNLENLILENMKQIIELAMINASLTNAHYKIVL